MKILAIKKVKKFWNLKKEQRFLQKKIVKAFLSESSPSITVGGEIVVEVYGKKYKGVVTDILQRDKNNNIAKIAYTIPFLNSDDPFKFGETNLTYSLKKYD